jgi:hypothetical protein
LAAKFKRFFELNLFQTQLNLILLCLITEQNLITGTKFSYLVKFNVLIDKLAY